MVLREQLQQDLQQVGLKDVAQGHPCQVHRQGVQGGADEVGLAGVAQHKHTDLMDEAEFVVQGRLQLALLGLRTCAVSRHARVRGRSLEPGRFQCKRRACPPAEQGIGAKAKVWTMLLRNQGARICFCAYYADAVACHVVQALRTWSWPDITCVLECITALDKEQQASSSGGLDFGQHVRRAAHLRQVKPCEVKHLLAEQLEDLHAILAQGLAGLGGADQVWDESAPFVGPVVLQDLDQDDVELVDEGRLPPEHGLVRGVRDDEVGQEVLDALPLFLGQGTPLEPDDVLQDLYMQQQEKNFDLDTKWKARDTGRLEDRRGNTHIS
eukprot:1136160-Pelagomonas_calceolata.AAC.7